MAASGMSGKSVKCPDCSFRGSTMKGMKIHRGRVHRLDPYRRHEATHPPTLPQEFFESLRPDQLNLLDASYSSHWINPSSQQSSESDEDGGPNTNQEVSEDTDKTSNKNTSDSFLNSCGRPSSSNTRGGKILNTSIERPPADTTPASSSRIGEPEIDSKSISGPVLLQYSAPQDATGSRQPSEPPALVYSGSGVPPEQGPIDRETKQNANTPRESLIEGRSPPDDTFIEYDMPGFQSIERGQRSSKALLPDSSHPRQDEQLLSIEFSDETGGMETGSRFCSARGLMGRTLYAGRNALKNLWPACFFDLTSLQPQEDGGFLRRENELRACRNFLTLLGNCAVLDYNASSAWDLVLRCSLCEMPMSGIRNMEAHIKKHLQQTQHSGDIRC